MVKQGTVRSLGLLPLYFVIWIVHLLRLNESFGNVRQAQVFAIPRHTSERQHMPRSVHDVILRTLSTRCRPIPVRPRKQTHVEGTAVPTTHTHVNNTHRRNKPHLPPPPRPSPQPNPLSNKSLTPTPARIQNTYINTHSQETPPHTDALSKQNDTHMKLFDGVVRCSMAASFDSVSKFRREAHPLSGANITCIHRKRGCEWLRKSIQDMVPRLDYSQQP